MQMNLETPNQIQQVAQSSNKTDLLQSHQHHTIQDIKYKIYGIVILVFWYLLYPMITNSAEQVTLAQQELENLTLQQEIAQKQYDSAKSNASFLWLIKNKQSQVISCINDNKCDWLPKSITESKDTVSRYLMMSKLATDKMSFNQEQVLSNINEFLLKDSAGNPNGTLMSVIFWSTKEIEIKQKLRVAPITMTIEFANKMGFLNFLKNVEKKINISYPVVYRITSLDYDIAASDITQIATIQADIYFYK